MSEVIELSPRRREVLELIAKGLSNQDIAAVLGISFATVKTHVEAILHSLDVSNRTEAVALYQNLASSEGSSARLQLHRPFRERPALAVTPFTLQGDTHKDDFLADGLVEEMITRLSRLRWLPVIARRSVFTYKQSSLEPSAIGRELNAAFVLTGSISRNQQQMRLYVELYEVEHNKIIWSQSYKSHSSETFLVQDQIAREVIGAVDQLLMRYLAEQSLTYDAPDLTAWETALRGFAHLYRQTRADHELAISAFESSKLQSPNAMACCGLADARYLGLLYQWEPDRELCIEQIGANLQAANRLSPRNDYIEFLRGVHSSLTGNFTGLVTGFENAVDLNPSNVRALTSLGKVHALSGQPHKAMDLIQTAIRLDPMDTSVWSQYLGMSMAHFACQEFTQALTWGHRAYDLNPGNHLILMGLAATHALTGDRDLAKSYLKELDESGKQVDSSELGFHLNFADPAVQQMLLEGLQKARQD